MANVPVRLQVDKEGNGAAPGKALFKVNGNVFEVDERYVPRRGVGRGAYGVVCSAQDTQRNVQVAIKKIGNAFDNVVDARRTLREMKLLRELQHENIISIRDVMAPPVENREGFKSVYLVYELMDTDLHQIIRSPQNLTEEHFQYFIYQLLRGLKFLHSANVLHRDLKPANLLLDANCDLKICDFGLARTRPEGGGPDATAAAFMTEYVVTRWYRAPELLLSCDTYDDKVDMWSVGCILGELLGRKAMFPGKDYMDQLKLIVRSLGNPADNELGWISSSRARAFLRALPPTERKPLSESFPGASADALDLLSKLLQFDPSGRVSAEEALAHPWLKNLHDPENEPVAERVVHFLFEDGEVEDEALRRVFWEEARHYQPQLPTWDDA